MKRISIIIASIYLTFMFLVYSGVFRDYTNPLDVTRHYFECMKNKEGFLTYKISAPGFFNPDKLGKIYNKYNMGEIKNFTLQLIENDDNNASVQAELVYRKGEKIYIAVKLEKKNKNWLISNTEEEI